MSREELIENICPCDNVYRCQEDSVSCDECKEELNKMLNEYDAKVRADAIDECIKAINDLNIEYAYSHTICNILEMLKE